MLEKSVIYWVKYGVQYGAVAPLRNIGQSVASVLQKTTNCSMIFRTHSRNACDRITFLRICKGILKNSPDQLFRYTCKQLLCLYLTFIYICLETDFTIFMKIVFLVYPILHSDYYLCSVLHYRAK